MSANNGIERGQTLTGARAYITLNGRPVGYTTRIQVNVTYTLRPLDVLDDIETVEQVPTSYNPVDITAEFVQLVVRNLFDLGVQPEQAVAVLGQTYVIEVKDRPSDTAQFVLEGVQFVSASWDITKANPTAANVRMTARRCRMGGKV